MYTGGSTKIPEGIWPKIDLQIIQAISQRELTAEGVAAAIQNTVSRYSITPQMLVRRAWRVVSRLPDVHFHIPKRPKSRKSTAHKPGHVGLQALDIPTLCKHVREEIPDADDELITAIIHRLLD